jgi:ATP-dependent phosphofructokinase / diphosphate-dependent phosphofructokinase
MFNKAGRPTLAILTGGGDVPGLNPAIRAITFRAIREGFQVLGLMRGWKGLVELMRDKEADNANCVVELTEELVDSAATLGGTFLKTSRDTPANVKKEMVPDHLKGLYDKELNDLTPEILKNLEFLEIDYLIPIGGDDTLSYASVLHREGVKIIGIPKTMDNDVAGTDYSIGFSTCVTRTIQMANRLRSSAESHERILVIEVFGRYAGFTAILPTLAGAANRCVIPEHLFDISLLTELLIDDRKKSLGKLSTVIVSEGARFEGFDESGCFEGISHAVANQIRQISPKFNNEPVNVIYQKLGYLVRGGTPDAIDSIVPMAFGNLALDLILKGVYGRMVALKDGRYDNVSLEVLSHSRKHVDIKRFYNTERYRPNYKKFEFQPLLLVTGGHN